MPARERRAVLDDIARGPQDALLVGLRTGNTLGREGRAAQKRHEIPPLHELPDRLQIWMSGKAGNIAAPRSGKVTYAF